MADDTDIDIDPDIDINTGIALFCCTGLVLLFLILVGVVALLAVDPLQLFVGLSVPNVVHNMLVLPAVNATVERAFQGRAETIPFVQELAEEDAWLPAPKHMWPTASEEVPDEDTTTRFSFWMTVNCLTVLVTILLGTAILQLCSFPCVRKEYARVEGKGVLKCPFCFLALLAHLTLVTKFAVHGALTDRLTPEFGACWEIYTVVLLYMCIADPFDTLKDALMAGIALNFSMQPDTELWRRCIAGAVGGFSLVYLWIFHLVMFIHPSSREELKAAYVSVWSLPDEAEAEAEAEAETETKAETKAETEEEAEETEAEQVAEDPWPCRLLQRAWSSLLPSIFMQVVPERQWALLREDLPQGLLASAFLAAHGWQAQVALLNVSVPALRLASAALLYPVVVRQAPVHLWLASESQRFRESVNSPRARLLTRLLLDALLLLTGSGSRLQVCSRLLCCFRPVSFTHLDSLFIHMQPSWDAEAHSYAGNADARCRAASKALARDLATLFHSLLHLRHLRLCENDLKDEGMATLAAALPSLRQLQILDLSWNRLADEGATALAAALPSLRRLQILDLSINDIKDAGATALAQELPSLGQLLKLDLRKNRIEDAGASALADAVAKLPQLQELDLAGNKFGPVGNSAFQRAGWPSFAGTEVVLGEGGLLTLRVTETDSETGSETDSETDSETGSDE